MKNEKGKMQNGKIKTTGSGKCDFGRFLVLVCFWFEF